MPFLILRPTFKDNSWRDDVCVSLGHASQVSAVESQKCSWSLSLEQDMALMQCDRVCLCDMLLANISDNGFIRVSSDCGCTNQ